MKVFSALILLFFSLGGKSAAGADGVGVSGPWVELRQAPLFSSAAIPLAATWGPALPVGVEFEVEKVYGRWIYGRPAPLSHMRKADFAPPGWIFSRMLLAPGDKDSLPPALVAQTRAFLYHLRATRKALSPPAEPAPGGLDFLEGLTLSERTLSAFSHQDELGRPSPASPRAWLSLLPPSAYAADPQEASAPAPAEAAPALGLAGPELNFLDQEIHVAEGKRKAAIRRQEALRLRPFPPPALNDQIRQLILGRLTLEKHFTLPPLTMEEVDGYVYMRATALRALRGCAKPVADRWLGRHWSLFRIYGLKDQPAVPHPWFELSLPGGNFAVSGRAIELASNEAELAFLLVRPFVRELRVKRQAIRFQPKSWVADLPMASDAAWNAALKAESTRESANLDVADEIAVDLQAIECISRAGYRPMSAIAYLRKLGLHREESWAKWVQEQSIGLDYRIERVTELTQDAVAHQRFPEGQASNDRRFASASKQWNLLP